MTARRGTTNRNNRGSSKDRAVRRAWLLAKFGDGEKAPCYRCGQELDDTTITVDRIRPGCMGGTYRRSNIRAACGPCNSETGGAMTSKEERSKRARNAQRRGKDAERKVAAWFREHGYPKAERAVRTGFRSQEADRGADPGDVAGTPFAIQVKDVAGNVTASKLRPWLEETDAQREELGAEFGLLIHRKRGVGDVGLWHAWVIPGARVYGEGRSAVLPSPVPLCAALADVRSRSGHSHPRSS